MKQKTTFVPQLIINHSVTDLSFYTHAFGARELWRRSNDDGSIHVAGLEIEGMLFHVHEEGKRTSSPDSVNSTTVIIGLMVDDVQAVFDRAVSAGAKVLSPVTDHEYQYRQADILDPFGHHWLIEKILR